MAPRSEYFSIARPRDTTSLNSAWKLGRPAGIFVLATLLKSPKQEAIKIGSRYILSSPVAEGEGIHLLPHHPPTRPPRSKRRRFRSGLYTAMCQKRPYLFRILIQMAPAGTRPDEGRRGERGRISHTLVPLNPRPPAESAVKKKLYRRILWGGGGCEDCKELNMLRGFVLTLATETFPRRRPN